MVLLVQLVYINSRNASVFQKSRFVVFSFAQEILDSLVGSDPFSCQSDIFFYDALYFVFQRLIAKFFGVGYLYVKSGAYGAVHLRLS